MLKIAITGPESSGKSFTTEYLARYFDGWMVPEFAREYLENLDRPYTEEDVLTIAKAQIHIEKDILLKAEKEKADLVIFDNELINTRIWMEEKYGYCPEWIHEAIQQSPYDHYLLMRPDLPWEADPLRENPHDRERLFQYYPTYLQAYQKPFTIIEGSHEKRNLLAVSIIKTFGIY